jgi:GH25 family lysozyme M1 (1,4-beta-N-acetylmuramidase)
VASGLSLKAQACLPCARVCNTAHSMRRNALLAVTLVACVAGLVSPAAADRPLGLDVSVYTPLTTGEWTAIRNSGRVFGFARSSYGWGGTDTQFVNHMTNGRAAGLYMGAYHFSYPGYSTGNTPINEANTFLNVARSYVTAGYLRPVLDIEYVGPNLGGLTLTQWCNQWMDYVEQQTGVEPLVYTGAYYAQAHLDSSICSRDLWIAAWPANPNPQTDNPAYLWLWSTWRFWQYAGDVTIPGVTDQKVDLNVFNGTLSQLQAFVIPAGARPTISRSPAALSPSAIAGLDAQSQNFVVANGGAGTLSYDITSDVTWLAVAPASGTSTGETDTITVTYQTATMEIGTYTGTITIADLGATNSPQVIDVILTVRPVPGDLNADGHIDGADLTLFLPCVSGPGVSQTDPDCQDEDLDDDGDVDQTDFGRLQRCFSGLFAPADPTCSG